MLSIESEVLMRHLSQFEQKNVLLFGDIRDRFTPPAAALCRFSGYFDFTRRHADAVFGLECETAADLGVFYWTKNKQECRYQLLQWLSTRAKGQEMLIIGENRCGVRSVEKLLAPFGSIAKIDSARRCGLYHFCLEKVPTFDRRTFWKSYTVADLKVFALPAVFSSGELDGGTKLLLSTFQPTDKLSGKVLDLGCGAGVIGASLKQQFPTIDLTLSDIHAMALASSERTLAENGLDGKTVASDVFSHIDDRFDLIVSNPPFHDGIDTAYQAVENLIQNAKKHLNRGGELRIVANAFLPYPDLLEQAFGRFEVLAKTGKFKVYSAKV